MHIDIITIFPQAFESPFGFSIIKRAIEKKLVAINIHNLRDYTDDRYHSVDDYPYGGGGGMVMMIEPVDRCISSLKTKRNYDEIIYLTPDGELLSQNNANLFSTLSSFILLCGHYKGLDERIRQHLVTREISIGDYVLSGGETAAMVFCDAVIRLIPGVISDEVSALTDSFQDGLVAPPVYTRPAEYKGWGVPSVLLSGNEKEILDWRMKQALERTRERRPGMVEKS